MLMPFFFSTIYFCVVVVCFVLTVLLKWCRQSVFFTPFDGWFWFFRLIWAYIDCAVYWNGDIGMFEHNIIWQQAENNQNNNREIDNNKGVNLARVHIQMSVKYWIIYAHLNTAHWRNRERESVCVFVCVATAWTCNMVVVTMLMMVLAILSFSIHSLTTVWLIPLLTRYQILCHIPCCWHTVTAYLFTHALTFYENTHVHLKLNH